MAKKKLKRGARRPLKRKYYQGGSAYALPTSLAGTTTNLMGLGDPATLQKNLDMANAAIQENAERIKQQEEQKALDQEQLNKQQVRNSLNNAQESLGQSLMPALRTGLDTTKVLNAKLGQDVGQSVANISTDVNSLLGNLNQVGTSGGNSLKGLGQGLKAGFQSAAPSVQMGLGSAGLGIAGAGVKALSNDKDATTMNLGETAGTLMQGAGMGLGIGSMLGLAGTGVGLPLALLGAAGYGIHGLIQRNKARVEEQKQEEQEAIARQNLSRAQSEAFQRNFSKVGTDMGFNIGNSITNSYVPSNQQMFMAKNGGLWDNIHAKRERIKNGSGEKMREPGSKGAPTDEALKRSQMEMGGDPERRARRRQERQTRRAQREFERKSKKGVQNIYEEGGIKVPGGKIVPLPGQAVEFVGKKHSEGGIMLDPKTEVEGGETMDKVAMSSNNMSDYIFSEHLKLGGKSFAKRHKEILKRGGSQKEIQRLAAIQEQVARKSGEKDRDPGAIKKMQPGGELFKPLNQNFSDYMQYESYMQDQNSGNPNAGTLSAADPNDPRYRLAPEAASAIRYPGLQPKNEQGLYNLPGRTGEDMVNMTDYEMQKAASPWFDWTNFDPANPADVDRFQKAYNELAPSPANVREDTFYGEQTTSARIPYKAVAPNKPEVPETPPGGTTPGPGCPCADGTTSPECCKKEGDTPGDTPEDPQRNRFNPFPLVGLLGLGNQGSYPPARTMSPQTARMTNLPRINLNAERAALGNQNVGTQRMLSNQAAGPAGMAMALAANRQTAEGLADVSAREGAQNIGLIGEEAGINANIGMSNANAVNQAGMFNAGQLQQRDINQAEQEMYNRQHRTDTITGVGRDMMQYRSDERYANAIDDTGSYMRLLAEEQAKTNALLKGQQKPEETTTARKGGYIARAKKLRRNKRRK